MSNYNIKDSGKRTQFDTGAEREPSVDKSRPDLVSPFALDRLGKHMAEAARTKYSEWNWAKGLPSSRCLESCLRHLNQFAMGETDEDHLAAAMFNLMVIIHNQEVAKRGIVMGNSRKLNNVPIFSPGKLDGDL